jgi:Uma2 family endonuclease
MSSATRQRLTPAEYLAIERAAERKSEFFNGEMFAMAGASVEHNLIKDNSIAELSFKLKGGPCRTLSSDQRILVKKMGPYTYPDIVIVCGQIERDAMDRDSLTNPVAVIKITSPSTEHYDCGAKFRSYQQIPSLKEYILIAQDEPVCERLVRQSDGSWALVSFVGLDATLTFATIHAEIPLADVYAGVEFPQTPAR